eukprot:COSAG01_NODE_3894_length_5575_cov_746.141136_6_plen_169_part_00
MLYLFTPSRACRSRRRHDLCRYTSSYLAPAAGITIHGDATHAVARVQRIIHISRYSLLMPTTLRLLSPASTAFATWLAAAAMFVFWLLLRVRAQQPRHFRVLPVPRVVERGEALAVRRRPHLRPRVQQQLRHPLVPVERRRMQGGVAAAAHLSRRFRPQYLVTRTGVT